MTDREGTHEEEVEYDTGLAEGVATGAALGGAAVGLELGALGGLGYWEDEAHFHAEAQAVRG